LTVIVVVGVLGPSRLAGVARHDRAHKAEPDVPGWAFCGQIPQGRLPPSTMRFPIDFQANQ
jgi:hypothetical protein